MTDHENLTVRLWDVIHDARATPSGHAPTSAIVAAVLPIVAGEVRGRGGEAVRCETTIRLDAEHDLIVQPHPDGVRLSLIPVRDAPAHVSFVVPTGELLRAVEAAGLEE